MMTLMFIGWGLILISYLIGSISSAVLVAKAFRLPDPRTIGSKNPGATNMLRSGGKLPAILTLLGDALKGWAPVYAAKNYLMNVYPIESIQWIIGAVFLATIVGHLYPIFFKFKGGKGVATTLGGLFALQIGLGLSFVGIWLGVALFTRYSALSALVASALLPVIAYTIAPEYAVVIGIASLLIFWRHRVNIQNLWLGTESKMGSK